MHLKTDSAMRGVTLLYDLKSLMRSNVVFHLFIGMLAKREYRKGQKMKCLVPVTQRRAPRECSCGEPSIRIWYRPWWQ